jgi:predicted transporter
MNPTSNRQEIDHRTLKLLVGLIAISLAGLTAAFADTRITSISASYHEGGWSQTVFIGFLFAIAAFLMAYNGLTKPEMVLSKVASLAALGVAMFPCKCDTHEEIIPNIHGISAALMFLILAYFCHAFFERAKVKSYPQARIRATIYAICGLLIVGSIVVLAYDGLTGHSISQRIPRLTYYGETTGLVAFGFSWLTASRVLPVLTRADERFSPLNSVNPD